MASDSQPCVGRYSVDMSADISADTRPMVSVNTPSTGVFRKHDPYFLYWAFASNDDERHNCLKDRYKRFQEYYSIAWKR